MKTYERTTFHQCVQKERFVGETQEDFRGTRDRGEIEQRQQPPTSVPAAGAKDRSDFRIAEERSDFGGAIVIATSQDSPAIQRVNGDFDTKPHRRENANPALEVFTIDSRCGSDDTNRVAGPQGGRLDDCGTHLNVAAKVIMRTNAGRLGIRRKP